ncbi:hypothetical protein OKW30_007399 [Paraburkholderia sp. Clong3]|uniref:DUF3846 domain-containing protein n=1 Tax=Paraburkholderia sp. Clong3 TaxID=2991061 RepID=UPI003D198E64
MRAILIDPHTRTVTEVDYNGEREGPDAASASTLIGCDITEALALDVNIDEMYVDDIGKLRRERPPWFLTSLLRNDWICGRALVVGRRDRHGHDTPPKLTLERVRESISWADIGCRQDHAVAGR